MFRVASSNTITNITAVSKSKELENGKRRPSIQKVVTKAKRTILGTLDQNQGRQPSTEISSVKRNSKLASASKTDCTKNVEFVFKTEPRAKVTVPEMESPQVDRYYEQDPQQVAEIAKDIYENLRGKEMKYRPSIDYLQRIQTDINDSMRSILVDWIIDVHYKFGMHEETLFLTINLIDRFLSVTRISKSKLQLVGVTCLLIAAKYEEIYPPSVRKLTEICDNIYSRDDIIEMEAIILDTLEYNITVATPFQFLSRYWKVAVKNEQEGTVIPKDEECQFILKNMMFYMAEIALVDFDSSVRFLPSVISATCLFLSMKIAYAIENQQESGKITDENIWDSHVQYYTGYTINDLRSCISKLSELIEKERINAQKNSKLMSIRKKWCRTSRSRVSTFIPDQYHLLLSQENQEA